MNSKMDFRCSFSPFTLTDLPAIADLHRQVFPDYFLTHMGQDFLQRFYQEFMSKPAYGIVAKHETRIVGFVAGTTELSNLYNQFYKHNFMALIRIVIIQFFADSYVRQNIRNRMIHFRRALSSLLSNRTENEQTSQVENSPLLQEAHLLSIGVAAEYRGYGIAETLCERFCTELKQAGVRAVYLSVFPDNKRAIRFYEKNGWQQTEGDSSSLLFFKLLDR